jgi:hypothetical protein
MLGRLRRRLKNGRADVLLSVIEAPGYGFDTLETPEAPGYSIRVLEESLGDYACSDSAFCA